MAKFIFNCLRVIFVLAVAYVVAVVLLVGYIMVELEMNRKTGEHFVESLHASFPDRSFRNAAGKGDKIYILAKGLDDHEKAEVEHWLRTQKAERRLSSEIWLSFDEVDDGTEEKRIKI